jgi:hypothetical protein
MNTVHNQHLAKITGIGKYLLLACHSGVKTNLAGGGPDGSKCPAVVYSSVFQQEDGRSCRIITRHVHKSFAKKRNSEWFAAINFSQVRAGQPLPGTKKARPLKVLLFYK